MNVLWLVPVLPLTGFLILTVLSSRLPRRAAAFVGVGSIGGSFFTTLYVAKDFLSRFPGHAAFRKHLWTWFDVGGLHVDMSFYLDSLTLTMMMVITGVGFLIHLYSVGYMAEDKDFSRFFACMNLFVTAMLILVMADNLPLLYLGWEGVGLCSYLLIGFWYTDKKNGFAARKAFVVTRVGDTAMAVGLFLLYQSFNTLDIQTILTKAPSLWHPGSMTATFAALLILGGAVGKSAQLPLQTWLPDAMAGPTPVSALIHAATMVTAGVYLIARTHVIFLLSPAAMTVTAVIGAATLLIAGFSALVQDDIKRVLAYSTISQLGYMFLALGVGAWTAAVFHLVTHAFFKALLFLCAGAVIHALGGEQDMNRMGGLKDRLPLVFWTFLIGSASLAALPLVTAGFFSKDMIIWESFASIHGGFGLWLAAVTGALFTSVYTFRMVFLTFGGRVRTPVHHVPGIVMTLPLALLAAFSIGAGFMETPGNLGNIHVFSTFLQTCLPETVLSKSLEHYEHVFQIIASVTGITGILLSVWLFMPRAGEHKPFNMPETIRSFLEKGWCFDQLYDFLFVKPYVTFAQINRHDAVDKIYSLAAGVTQAGSRLLTMTQNGRLRTYAWGIGLGAAAVIALVVFL